MGTHPSTANMACQEIRQSSIREFSKSAGAPKTKSGATCLHPDHPWPWRWPGSVIGRVVAATVVVPSRLRTVAAAGHGAPAPGPTAAVVEEQPGTLGSATFANRGRGGRREQVRRGPGDGPEGHGQGHPLVLPAPGQRRSLEVETKVRKGLPEGFVEALKILARDHPSM